MYIMNNFEFMFNMIVANMRGDCRRWGGRVGGVYAYAARFVNKSEGMMNVLE